MLRTLIFALSLLLAIPILAIACHPGNPTPHGQDTSCDTPPSPEPNGHDELAADHTLILDQLDHIQSLIEHPLCGAGTEAQRFVVSADDTEVCDNNTGLHWERAPSGGGVWLDAVAHCVTLDLGNGQVYRLPEIRELHSLVDYSRHGWAIPAGHPFIGVGGSSVALIWSSTPSSIFPETRVWEITFAQGQVIDVGKDVSRRAWCVH